jgi:hypothetical protein
MSALPQKMSALPPKADIHKMCDQTEAQMLAYEVSEEALEL